jgi:hypothetical protein
MGSLDWSATERQEEAEGTEEAARPTNSEARKLVFLVTEAQLERLLP